MIRVTLQLFIIALLLTAGIGLVSMSFTDRSPWFTAGLGLFMVGQAVKRFGVSPSLASMRQRTGMSVKMGLRATAVLYVCAGALVAVGGLMTLERAFGLIVAFAAVSWSWAWGWVLMRSSAWFEPSAPTQTF